MTLQTSAVRQHDSGINVSSLAFILSVVAYLCTLFAFVAAAGSWYGTLNTRMASLEAQASRQTAANEANTAAFRELAQALIQVQTLIDERTTRIEARSAQNQKAIEQSRAQFAAKKPRSLANIIGITK